MTMVTAIKRGSADTGRGPSDGIWADCPWLEMLRDPGKGLTWYEEFMQFAPTASTSGGTVTEKNGGWSTFLSQNATIANISTPTAIAQQGGQITLTSTGDNDGITLCSLTTPFLLTAGSTVPTGKLWFEARLKSSTITDTKHGIWFGLLESLTPTAILPIADAGTLADKNFIGFHRLEGDGDQFDFVWKADGQTQQSLITDMISGGLVADTYVKLGFVYDPSAPNTKKIKVFINGVPQTTYGTNTQMTAATFPSDICLGPALCIKLATASTPGTTTFDWLRCGQLIP